MKIINFEKKKMKLLTEKQKESYENENFLNICKGNFDKNFWAI